MLILEQITDIHDRLGNSKTLGGYLRALRDIGVEKWAFDTAKLTITYLDKAGNVLLTEQVE